MASQRANYDRGNLPPRRSEYVPKTEYMPPSAKYMFTSKGAKQPLEAISESNTLDISKYSPQLWPELIKKWKATVVRDYLSKNFNYNGEQMVRYSECFVGPTAKRI